MNLDERLNDIFNENARIEGGHPEYMLDDLKQLIREVLEYCEPTDVSDTEFADQDVLVFTDGQLYERRRRQDKIKELGL